MERRDYYENLPTENLWFQMIASWVDKKRKFRGYGEVSKSLGYATPVFFARAGVGVSYGVANMGREAVKFAFN